MSLWIHDVHDEMICDMCTFCTLWCWLGGFLLVSIGNSKQTRFFSKQTRFFERANLSPAPFNLVLLICSQVTTFKLQQLHLLSSPPPPRIDDDTRKHEPSRMLHKQIQALQSNRWIFIRLGSCSNVDRFDKGRL